MLTQQIYILAFDYKKIPLFLGVVTVTGSVWLARDVQKYNNSVLEARDMLHQLKTGCDMAQCRELLHEIIDLSELPIAAKRHRCGWYNTWYYQKKGVLAVSNDAILHAVLMGEQSVYDYYQNIEYLPDDSVQGVFEKTSEKALKATIFRHYNQALFGTSLFYLKYKK